jgi:hypothetical protein
MHCGNAVYALCICNVYYSAYALYMHFFIFIFLVSFLWVSFPQFLWFLSIILYALCPWFSQLRRLGIEIVSLLFSHFLWWPGRESTKHRCKRLSGMVIVRGEPSACAKKRINQNGDKERRRGETQQKRKRELDRLSWAKWGNSFWLDPLGERQKVLWNRIRSLTIQY